MKIFSQTKHNMLSENLQEFSAGIDVYYIHATKNKCRYLKKLAHRSEEKFPVHMLYMYFVRAKSSKSGTILSDRL